MYNNNINTDSYTELEERLNKAREDTKQLYAQINYIKSKNQDSDLITMAKNVPSILSNNNNNSNSPTISSALNNTSPGGRFNYTSSSVSERGSNLKNARTLKGHHNKIQDVKWSQDSSTVLSASQDGFMLLWDAATGWKKNAIVLENQWVLSCAISPNKRFVASAGLDNHCTVYKIDGDDVVQQKIVSIFKGHTCYISECEFLSNNFILTASGDMTACKWDITKGMKTMEFSEHLGDILALATPKSFNNGEYDSLNNNIFATAGSDGHIFLWDSRQQKSVQKFLVGDTDVGSLQFFSDNNAIASGSDDGLVRLFDLRADCKIAEYSIMQKQHLLSKQFKQTNGNNKVNTPLTPFSKNIESTSLFTSDSTYDIDGVVSIDFSSSGRLLYVCYSNYGCVIWDTLKGEVVGTLDGHNNRIVKVKSSNNGFGVLTGSWDETIKIWTPGYM